MIRRLRLILSGRTPDAIRAASLPDITEGAVSKVERPSSMPCTPNNRCDSCRGLMDLEWRGGAS